MIIKSIHTYPIFLALFGWYSTGVCYRQSHNSLAIVKEWDKYAWWLESRGSDGGGDSRDGAGRVGYAFDFHGPPMRCGVYLMKLIQSMLQRAETIFFLTSWMVGRHIPSSGGNCLPRLLKTLSAFPICDFYSNLDQHTIHTFEYMYTIQLPGNGFPVSRIFGSIFFSSWNIFKDWGKWRLKPLSNRSKLENHIHIGT